MPYTITGRGRKNLINGISLKDTGRAVPSVTGTTNEAHTGYPTVPIPALNTDKISVNLQSYTTPDTNNVIVNSLSVFQLNL